MNVLAESFLRDVRAKLGFASECERAGLIELADAAGQVARNKMESAVRIDLRDSINERAAEMRARWQVVK